MTFEGPRRLFKVSNHALAVANALIRDYDFQRDEGPLFMRALKRFYEEQIFGDREWNEWNDKMAIDRIVALARAGFDASRPAA
jgi:hypothetical protein